MCDREGRGAKRGGGGVCCPTAVAVRGQQGESVAEGVTERGGGGGCDREGEGVCAAPLLSLSEDNRVRVWQRV